MKRNVMFALAFIASLCSKPLPISADSVNLDGTWWTGLTDENQVVSVQGLLVGYSQGYNNGYIHAAIKDRNDYHSTRSDNQLTNDPDSHASFSKTFGQYEQEVTDFYSQHPNAMDVLVGDVLACLADDPQFTCDAVAKLHTK